MSTSTKSSRSMILWPKHTHKLRSLKSSNEQVRFAMKTYSKTDFNTLVAELRKTTRQFLNTSQLLSMQDPAQWQNFMNQVAIDHPRLEVYTDFWPVHILVDKYLQRLHRKRVTAKKMQVFNSNIKQQQSDKDNEVDISTYSGAEDTASSHNQQRHVLGTSRQPNIIFVGKTPPRFRQRKTNGSVFPPLGMGSSFSSALTANKGVHSSTNRELTPSPSSMSLRRNGLHTISHNMPPCNATVSCPVACFGCGFLPSVPESRTVKLRQFFKDRESLLPILASIGIAHDHQLELLLKLSNAARIDFFERLVPRKLSALQLAKIDTRFSEYLKFSSIPSKRETEEATNIKYEAVEESSEEEGDYDNDNTDNDRDHEKEDIHFTPATSKRQEKDARSCENASTTVMPNAAGSVRCLACPYIPLVVPDFSREFKTFLQSCSMEELMPAFTSLGIFTDDDFQELWNMGEDERDRLFRGTSTVKLTEFQCKLLQLAFRKVDST